MLNMRKLMYRIGHRGAFLLFLSLLDILYGYSLLSNSFSPNIHWYIAPHIWGIIWIVFGVVIATGIFTRIDYFQFSVAALLKCAWAATWIRIWLFNDIPEAWISVVLWTAFAALVVIVATWTEPPRFHRALQNGRDQE